MTQSMTQSFNPEKVKEFFLNDKPVAALMAVQRINGPMGDECYGRMVSLKIDSTYAHTVKTLAKMREFGLIDTEKRGRKKVHTLTSLGEKYADIFEDLLHNLNEDFGSENVTLDPVAVDNDSGSYPPQIQS